MACRRCCCGVALEITVNTLLHMGERGPLPNPERDHVLMLYRRGTLATLAEGAWLAGVTRPLVLRWLRAARIDWKAARQRYIAELRRRAAAIASGKPVKRRTKAEMRSKAVQAMADFNAKRRS